MYELDELIRILEAMKVITGLSRTEKEAIEQCIEIVEKEANKENDK